MAASTESPRMSHSKSTCRARRRERCLAAISTTRFQLAHQIRQFDGDFSSFRAFIAAFAASAIHGLLHIVGGEHAEGDRNSGVEADAIEAVGSTSGDIF